MIAVTRSSVLMTVISLAPQQLADGGLQSASPPLIRKHHFAPNSFSRKRANWGAIKEMERDDLRAGRGEPNLGLRLGLSRV